MSSSGWYGVDFDGCLAEYTKICAPGELGKPLQPMVDRVKKWIAEGIEVKIFTARAAYSGMTEKDIEAQIKFSEDFGENLTRDEAIARIKYWNDATEESITAIKAWCKKYIGTALEVTCTKDFRLIELFDDRARQVEFNTGRLLTPNGWE